MCHEPDIRMWVSRIRSPEKKMRHHLPRASTRSSVRPVMGLSSFTRASGASVVSNLVTILPASALFNARAARKMLSPSGIAACLRRSPRQGRQIPPHVEPKRRRLETCIKQEARERMLGYRNTIHAADEHRRAAAALRIVRALNISGEEIRKRAGNLRTRRFIFRQQHLEVWIAPAKIGGQGPVNQYNACSGSPSEYRTLLRRCRPAQQRTIRVRGIGRGEHHHLMLLLYGRAQRTQQIDSRRKRKLCRTEVGREVAAPNAPALLKSLQHVIDRAEAAGQIFSVCGFAKHYAISCEQLLRHRMTPHGLRGCRGALLSKRRGIQAPSSLRARRSRSTAAEAFLIVNTPRLLRAS